MIEVVGLSQFSVYLGRSEGKNQDLVSRSPLKKLLVALKAFREKSGHSSFKRENTPVLLHASSKRIYEDVLQ